MLAGRLTGSKGEKLATQYVANIFKQLGLEPVGDNGTYFQNFEFKLIKQKNKLQQGRNVLAKLAVPHSTGAVLIVGAHGDHLGQGEFGSLAQNKNHQIHYGADDNASGVASVLAAAAELSDLKAHNKLQGNKDIIFAIWSGEELGSLGAAHFINLQNKKSLHKYIDAYINLDMVGRYKNKFMLQGVSSSSQWPDLINQSNKNSLSIEMQNDPYLPTDSTLFYINNVPAINFFTGSHAEYHTPLDKPELLNYYGMQQIAEFLVNFVLTLEKQTALLDYQQTQTHHNLINNSFKVYLGTIPDYTSTDVEGVKLAGVVKGSPAEHAGLKQNDVIVELAGQKIQNVYDYAAALHSLKPADSVLLVFLRAQQKLSLQIVAQAKS